MNVTNKFKCFILTCYYITMFHNNVMLLYNIRSWCGKEVTDSSHRQGSETVQCMCGCAKCGCLENKI